MIITRASDPSDGFDLNRLGDAVTVTGVRADWCRFQVAPVGSATFGNAEVSLLGSLDPSGLDVSSFYELDVTARLSYYGISRPINVTGIPTLRVAVVTVHGGGSSLAIVRIAYDSDSVP